MRTMIALAAILAAAVPLVAGAEDGTSAAAPVAATPVATAPTEAAEPPAYVVQDGKASKEVFNGYRRYGESCMRCHGPDGAGSSYAPSLTDSLKHLSHDDFVNTVVNGRVNVSSSQNNVMPSFGTTEDVILYVDDIYGYLKARSDDKLPRGRPKRIETSG